MDRKYRSCPEVALHLDRPAKEFNEGLDDVETQAGAGVISGCRAVDLAELVKHKRQQVVGYSRTGVGHFELEDAFRLDDLHGYIDGTALCELNCVVNEIGQNLLKL